SKSLASLIKNENYSDITYGIKLGDFNVGQTNHIYTFPYFCAFRMKDFLRILAGRNENIQKE
ncbi:MAG: ATP-binding protein, partial [Lachnospiraceae bacterium]|nr:ATP-binding protein [Lachnospiraceae bacterium]